MSVGVCVGVPTGCVGCMSVGVFLHVQYIQFFKDVITVLQIMGW